MELERFSLPGKKNRFNCETDVEVKVAERRTDFKLLPPPRCHVGGLWGVGGRGRPLKHGSYCSLLFLPTSHPPKTYLLSSSAL